MTEDTKNLALVIEGLPPVTRDEIEKIISELGEMIKKFCGGEITAKILSKDQNEAIIA
ncbi:MAG: hypothetical protein GW780_02715 [Candidatus Aenigmarchaeota archaeon]|nr:hypothetical protein [Candidatus Aenigmarchaeota archaeon]NCS71057.1 hypothetical protein [Candidatus Aenigmarchaeota archaeon]